MIKEPNNDDDDDQQWSTITGYQREQSTDAEFSLRMTIEKRRGGGLQTRYRRKAEGKRCMEGWRDKTERIYLKRDEGFHSPRDLTREHVNEIRDWTPRLSGQNPDTSNQFLQ